MNVPFLDLDASYREIHEEIDHAIQRVLRSGRYVGGVEVATFEEDYASFVGSKFCIGVANGMEALHLSLRVLNIGPGDEVIVPSNTFIATWLAVTQSGAIPVPVEPDSRTFNIDVTQIEEVITRRTKAIIPVHLYGQPADLNSVLDIAGRHGLRVIEDAAQAQGARYRQRRIGAHSDLVAWSFYPGKNLGAFGDAGAVTTNDACIADSLRVLRNYGSRERYVNEVPGYNSRLDPIQAAALRAKLKYLVAWNERRSRIAACYDRGLQDLGLVLPFVPAWAEPSWHLYCVRYPARDWLRAMLTDSGVETLIHYPIPPHLQRAYAGMQLSVGSLPIAEKMAREVISLPIGPAMSDSQTDFVIAAIRQALGA